MSSCSRDNTAAAACISVSAHSVVHPTNHEGTISSTWHAPDRNDGHRGIDIAVPTGTPLFAFAAGTVVAAQDRDVQGFGGWIVIDHMIGGQPMSTVYGHIDPGGIIVKTGDIVTAGQRIGLSGNSGQSTGPHLHFELWEGGRLTHSGRDIDPKPWLDNTTKTSTQTEQTRQGERTGQGEHGVQGAQTKQGENLTVQDRNAAILIETGKKRGVPDELQVMSIATGIVESGLKNLASYAVPESIQYPHDAIAGGDADSVGIHQQRPSQGWGTVQDLMNVEYQANNFYDRIQHSGWKNKIFAEAIADIQRPAEQYRYRYGEQEQAAREIFTRLTGTNPAECLPNPGIPNNPATFGPQIVAIARKQIGQPYVWGGGNENGPTGGGFDCSGLTLHAVYQASGGTITLPHYTGTSVQPGQIHLGVPVAEDQLQPGDLVFFGTGQDADHVGIYSGQDQNGVPLMIHAPQPGETVTESSFTGDPIAYRRIQPTPTTKENNDQQKSSPSTTASPAPTTSTTTSNNSA